LNCYLLIYDGNIELTQDLVYWADIHVSYSFEASVRNIYNNMKAGFSKLQKHNFTNWFITKTGGIKGKDQLKLTKSMSELFIKFDNNNSRIIEFEEFRNY